MTETEAGKPAPTLKEVADKLRRGRSDMSDAFSNQKERMLDEGYDLISDALKDLDSLASEPEREQEALKHLHALLCDADTDAYKKDIQRNVREARKIAESLCPDCEPFESDGGNCDRNLL